MKLSILAIAALLPTVWAGTVLAGEVKSSANRCALLGRVLISYDSGIPALSKLCADGDITVGEGLKVKISCYQKAQNKWLDSGTYSIDRLCSENRRAHSACWFLPFCTRSISKLSIQSPKTAVLELSEDTPKVAWGEMDFATDYAIIIYRYGQSIFETRTTETHVNLEDDVSFEPGQFYSIKVKAYRDSELIDNASVGLKVLSEEEQVEIDRDLLEINAQSLE